MRRLPHPLLALAPLLVGLSTTLDAENWTRFRGPDGAGLLIGGKAPVSFKEEDYKWKVALPGVGHSSPLKWEDNIYITATKPGDGERYLLALSAETGDEIWRYADKFEPYHLHQYNSYASANPTVDESGVYAVWMTGDKLYAFALDHQGEERWKVPVGTFHAQHGSAVNVVVEDGVLLVNNENRSDDSFIAGYSTETGERLWRVDRPRTQASYAAPATYKTAGGDTVAVFASTDGGILAVKPKNGETVWKHNPNFRTRVVGGPVIMGNKVFVVGGQGGGGKEAVVVRIPPEGESEAKLVWQERRGLPYVPVPVSHQGLLYLINDAGIITVVEAETGEEVYKHRLGGEYFGSQLLIGDKIYIISKRGELVVLQSGREFKELARTPLGEMSYATPAYADGRLYLRTKGHLIAVE